MNVVEFLRVSTQDQANNDRAGIPRQKEANARTIQKHNLTIFKTITLIDVSGTSVLDTPEVKNLIDLMCSGQIAGVVVADWDRLIRLDNFNDLGLFQNFRDSNTLIFLPDQVIDLNTQSGSLIGGFQAIIAGNELKQIKKRMLDAKETKRRNGEHPNCDITLPTGVGYDRENRKFYYTPNIEKVKELFDIFYCNGIQNYRELQRLTGFHHRTISNLLRNEIYIGYRAYTHKRSPEKNTKPDGRRGDKKKIKRSPDKIIRVKVIDKPLIDEGVFRDIQEIVKNKSTEYHKKKSLPGKRFLYAGFLRCGECSQILYSTSGGKNHQKDYYYCRSKNYLYSKKNGSSKCKSCYMQKERVENTVTSFVSERLTDKNYLNSLIKHVFSNNKIKEAETQIQHHKQELKRIERKRVKILDLYGDGLFTKQELDKKVNCLNDEVSAIKFKLSRLERSEALKKDIIDKKNIESIVTALVEFPYWTPTQKRTYLKSQMPELSLTKKGVTEFTFNFCKLGNHTDTDSWPPPA